MTEQNYIDPPQSTNLVSIPQEQLTALQQTILDLQAQVADLQHRFAAAQGGLPDGHL